LIGQRLNDADDAIAARRAGEVLLALRHANQNGLVIAGEFGQVALAKAGPVLAVLRQQFAERVRAGCLVRQSNPHWKEFLRFSVFKNNFPRNWSSHADEIVNTDVCFAGNVMRSVKGIAFSHRRDIMNRRQFLATMMAMGATLAACAAPPAQPAQPAQPAPPANTAAPEPTAAATVAPEPVAGGNTLTLGFNEEPDTLNPYKLMLFASQKVIWGVMNGLMTYDTELKLQPALAESYSISDDSLDYTFKLRKGVKWHDGQPFTAADVVASWKIIMDPKFGAFDQTGWNKIKDIETPDDHTVVMKTTEKYAPFLPFVGITRISPRHLIDKGIESFQQEFGRNPIGTGPYKFVKWNSGQNIELAANPDYFGGAPKIDTLLIKIVPDTNTIITQLKTGEVQMTDALSAVDFDSVKDLPDVKAETLTGLNWAHIDLKNIEFLMDKRVRQALDFATPREQIVNQLLKGLATVAHGDQSPISPAFNPNITPRPYDLDKAAALLTEAGFVKNANGILEKDGKPLKIEYYAGSGDKQALLVQQAVSASWRKLGVDVEELQQEIRLWATADGMFYRKAMTANQYEWFNSIDPENMFFWHTSFTPKEPGGVGGNFPAVFNPYEQQAKFDELTAAGAAEMDEAKRMKIYQDVQVLLHEEVPVIFLFWGKRVFVAPKNLNYTTNAALPLLVNAETWSLAS
jgi:peptide/nickel transport system substrate-binding protein